MDWFAFAAELTAPETRAVVEYIDAPYVESNETFPILDEDFDQ